MIGVTLPQVANSRIHRFYTANDSFSHTEQLSNWPLPKYTPENLYAGEYLQLAEKYLANWNHKEAAKCLAKVRKLAPDTLLEREASKLEKYQLFSEKQFALWCKVEKLLVNQNQGENTAYMKALKEFVKEYPNCQFAMETLHDLLTAGAEKELCYKKLSAMDPDAYPEHGVPEHIIRNFSEYTSALQYMFNRIFYFGRTIVSQQNANAKGFLDRSGNFHLNNETNVFDYENYAEAFSNQQPKQFFNFMQKARDAARCTNVLRFSEGLAPAEINKYWGFMDPKCKIVIEPVYTSALWFNEGLAPVLIETKWGFINKENKLVIQPQFDEALCFHNGLAAVSINHKTGYINKSGKFVILPKYDGGESFSDGLARVVNLETPIHRLHEYYIDTKGNKVFDLNSLKSKFDTNGEYFENQFDYSFQSNTNFLAGALSGYNTVSVGSSSSNPGEETHQFSDQRLLVHLKGRCGYVDTTGKLVIRANYFKARSFSEGLAAVSLDPETRDTLRGCSQLFGFIDKNGKMVISPKYSEVGDFHEGLAYVKITEDIGGFIDTTGKLVLQFKGRSTKFKNGLAPVEKSEDLY
ncbi:MAG: WG repeat-containing protein [Cyanobacteria bacterium TGS_CYA1]|nr:WG repeat-containing protein [Cyanobacteria bacterium TGS_CYA1]